MQESSKPKRAATTSTRASSSTSSSAEVVAKEAGPSSTAAGTAAEQPVSGTGTLGASLDGSTPQKLPTPVTGEGSLPTAAVLERWPGVALLQAFAAAAATAEAVERQLGPAKPWQAHSAGWILGPV